MSSKVKTKKVQSLIYLAMHMINHDSELKQVLPEMLYTMDEDTLVRFLKVCGGRTIKIPTLDEVALNLITAVIVHKILKENLTLEIIYDQISLPKSYKDYITDKVNKFMMDLSTEEKSFINNI